MNADAYLQALGYTHQHTIQYQNTRTKSEIYAKGYSCVILDDVDFKARAKAKGKEAPDDNIMRYKEYTAVQNALLKEYATIFRFLNDDPRLEDKLADLLNPEAELSFAYKDSRFDRSHVGNSILEDRFEKVFLEAFPYANLGYLKKEKRFSPVDGNVVFIDYVFQTDKHKYAVEINGDTYHNPEIIGKDRYRKQLDKQNLIFFHNYKLLRFSTENVHALDEIVENLRWLVEGKVQDLFTIPSKRSVAFKEITHKDLYAHQKEILSDLSEERKAGKNAYLLHLPTGTGKTHIALCDVLDAKAEQVLVLVPTNAIKKQWLYRKKDALFRKQFSMTVMTYAAAVRNPDDVVDAGYDYVIFDEAHHAQAPLMSQVLKELDAEFLLGLTATDERLDQKRLEELFGEYETKMSIEDGVKAGVLSPLRVFRLQSNVDLSEVRINGKEFVNADLEKTIRIESRNELIAQTLQKYAPYFDYLKAIVFCVNINHAEEMQKQFEKVGFNAQAVHGKASDKKVEEAVDAFRNGDVQVLTSVQMLSEGFDAPETNILVMARPTLSKVVYLQQLGRGLRKAPGKEELYVIDVVDNYGPLGRPWSLNSVLKVPHYRPFMNPFQPREAPKEFLVYTAFTERELALKEIDVHTFEEKYRDMLSVEETARELFVSTGTLHGWMKKGEVKPDESLPFGRRQIHLFHPESLPGIRKEKGLKERTEETLKEDFMEFIETKSYTFSFKIIFMFAMLKNVDNRGSAFVREAMEDYRNFYLDRIKRGLPVDRPHCRYTKENLQDDDYVIKSIRDNPFEKFERKRFMFQSKDLDTLSFHPKLFNRLEKNDIITLKETLKEHLEEYYDELGGVDTTQPLFQ